MKQTSKLILAAFATATLVPATTLAQGSKPEAYWTNSTSMIWKNPYGLCWRAGYWTPAQAIAECDPDLVKKPAPPLPPVAAAAPPPPQTAPAPAPAPVPPPPPPTVTRVTFSAEELFDFDQYVLRQEGKAALDKFALDLGNSKYDVIVATGHTDRIGSPAYNQKLSERRANAVKAYLISKGVPPDRISSVGKGETQPVTKPGDCTGPRSKKLIACLQPDRRVEVEVTATKEVPAAR